MPEEPAQPGRRARREWVPYFVLALSLAATAAAAAFIHTAAEKQDRGRFDVAAERTRNLIAHRAEVYGASIQNMAALFQTGGIPSRDQFREYVGRLDLRRRYPGIVGLGFSLRVAAGGRSDMAKLGREQVDPSFRIWPDRPAGEECHTIFYLEPADGPNRLAVGYDMHTEPVRAAAMDAARDNAAPVASGRVELVQDAGDPGAAGFLIYSPLYKDKLVPESVGDRRAKLYGYVYAPFRAGELLRGVVLNDPRGAVDFRVYDGSETDPSAALYDSAAGRAGAAAPGRPRYARRETIEVAGRPWTIEFVPSPAFDHASRRWLLPLVVAAGCGVSLTFFALTRGQVVALREGRRAKEAAERANEAKDRFLAVLSHELRTPLSPVMAAAGLWRDDPSLPPELREDMRMIGRSVQLEARLIDDLLDLTRIAQGKVRLQPETLDAHDAVREVVAMFADEAAAKRLSVTTDLAARRSHVDADPARLHQVFLNLLSNAIKFTPDGGTITVRSTDAGGGLRVEVADTGVGIDASVLPRLFNAFEQGEQTVTRRFGGLGLGLSIVKSLVDMHGGTITAASAGPGRGATFATELKTVPAPRAVSPESQSPASPSALAAAADAGAPPEVAAPADPAAPEPNGGAGAEAARILLVEDHADTRRVLVRLLCRSGYAVTPAGSVKEAIEAADGEPFDLLVSDIGLPDGTGHDVMRYLRNKYDIRGIAVSGFAQDEDLRRSREAGFETHLAKPVDFRMLREVVDAAAKRSPSPVTST